MCGYVFCHITAIHIIDPASPVTQSFSGINLCTWLPISHTLDPTKMEENKVEDNKMEDKRAVESRVEDKTTSELPPKQRKLTLKDVRSLTGSLLKDLRQLQREGQTLPDILYNYRVQDGRLVRKRPRRGSFAEGEERN